MKNLSSFPEAEPQFETLSQMFLFGSHGKGAQPFQSYPPQRPVKSINTKSR